MYYYLADALTELNRSAEAVPLLEKIPQEFEKSEYIDEGEEAARGDQDRRGDGANGTDETDVGAKKASPKQSPASETSSKETPANADAPAGPDPAEARPRRSRPRRSPSRPGEFEDRSSRGIGIDGRLARRRRPPGDAPRRTSGRYSTADHSARPRTTHMAPRPSRCSQRPGSPDRSDASINARIATTWATILSLPRPDAGIDQPAGVGHAAQSRHRQLAADHDRHDPRLDHVELDQRDERRGGQQLVGDRIEQLAEHRDLLAAPRQVTVQPVGQRGDAEDQRRRHPLGQAQDQVALERGQQHHDQQRDQDDARQGEGVRQVHWPPTNDAGARPIVADRV